MNDILLWAGRLTGAIGVVTCALALFVRISGAYTLVGFEVGTLFLGGTAAMVRMILVHLSGLLAA